MSERLEHAPGKFGCPSEGRRWAQNGHTQGFTGWKAMRLSRKTSMILVPEGGLEPPQAQGPSDFESEKSKNQTPQS